MPIASVGTREFLIRGDTEGCSKVVLTHNNPAKLEMLKQISKTMSKCTLIFSLFAGIIDILSSLNWCFNVNSIS